MSSGVGGSPYRKQRPFQIAFFPGHVQMVDAKNKPPLRHVVRASLSVKLPWCIKCLPTAILIAERLAKDPHIPAPVSDL